jgi:hypothetical protein
MGDGNNRQLQYRRLQLLAECGDQGSTRKEPLGIHEINSAHGVVRCKSMSVGNNRCNFDSSSLDASYRLSGWRRFSIGDWAQSVSDWDAGFSGSGSSSIAESTRMSQRACRMTGGVSRRASGP